MCDKKSKYAFDFFRLWLRVCLAFHAQIEFLDEPKCVERGITPTFQHAAARLQTRKPREMRTEKLRSGKLILGHSLPMIFIDLGLVWAPATVIFIRKSMKITGILMKFVNFMKNEAQTQKFHKNFMFFFIKHHNNDKEPL